MSVQARKDQYITEARAQARKLWEGYIYLKSMQEEWTGQDYGNTLGSGSGSNEGITSAQIGSVIFDTVNAVDALMDAGHATNVTNVL